MFVIGCVCLLWIWGGIMDMLMDGSLIIDCMLVQGFYLNVGWCYGGFKVMFVSGYVFVYLLVIDMLYDIVCVYCFDCFQCGFFIDEKGMGVMFNLY